MYTADEAYNEAETVIQKVGTYQHY